MRNKTGIFTSILGVASLIIVLASCNKNKEYALTSPGSFAHFTGARTVNYSMTTATPAPVIITVGTTDVASSDRTVTLNITSKSGAVKGTHYNLSITGNTVTIPAGKATADISVQGIYAPYTSGRKDTLIFAISAPSVDPAKFQDTVLLVLRGPCFEGDVDLSALMGTYANTIETYGTGAPYGPYTTTISAVTQTGPTTGTITVTNIYNDGWGPIVFNLDWSDPANRTAIVVPQTGVTGSNAGDFNATYNGMPFAVRAFAGQPGTFSACNNTFTLNMQLGVGGATVLGYFAGLYQVKLAR